MSKITVKTSPIIGPMGISIGMITEAESSPIPPLSNVAPTPKQKKKQEIKEIVVNLRLKPEERHRILTRKKWRERRDRLFSALSTAQDQA